MNIVQEKLAEKVINVHKDNNGTSNRDHLISSIDFGNKLNKNVIIDALLERGILTYMGENQYVTRLTEYGWEFPGFEKHRLEKKETKETEKTINDLTIKQLKGNIFHLKYWWLLLLVSGVIGLITGNITWILSCIESLFE